MLGILRQSGKSSILLPILLLGLLLWLSLLLDLVVVDCCQLSEQKGAKGGHLGLNLCLRVSAVNSIDQDNYLIISSNIMDPSVVSISLLVVWSIIESLRGPFNPNKAKYREGSPLFLQHLLQLQTLHGNLSFLLVVLTGPWDQWGQPRQGSGKEKPSPSWVRGSHHPGAGGG